MHLNGGKLLKCHLNENSCMKWAAELNCYHFEKKKMHPRGSSAPILGQYTYTCILP